MEPGDWKTGARLAWPWLGTYGALYTADSKQFFIGIGDYTIKVWDGETAKTVRQLGGHFGLVYALIQRWQAPGSASLDGTARLWDLEKGQEISQFSPQARSTPSPSVRAAR